MKTLVKDGEWMEGLGDAKKWTPHCRWLAGGEDKLDEGAVTRKSARKCGLENGDSEKRSKLFLMHNNG